MNGKCDKLRQLLVCAALLLLPLATLGQVRLSEYVVTYQRTPYHSIARQGTVIQFSDTVLTYATCQLPFAMPFGNNTLAAGTPIACSTNGFLYLNELTINGVSASPSGHMIIHAIQENRYGAIGNAPPSCAYYYHNTVDNSFTIEYVNLRTYNYPGTVFSYQIVLRPSGDITIAYDTMACDNDAVLQCYLTDQEIDNISLDGSWLRPDIVTGRPNYWASGGGMNKDTLPIGMSYTFHRSYGSCPAPGMLRCIYVTTDSAILSWHALVHSAHWEIEYADSAFTPGCGQGSPILCSDTVCTITGLSPHTKYHAYLRCDCDSEYSTWRHVEFTTACSSVISQYLPLYYGFEDVALNALDSCWTFGSHSSTNQNPYSSSPSSDGHHHMMFTARNAEWGYMASPRMAEPLDTLQLTFECRRYYSYEQCLIVVGSMSNPCDPTTFHPLDTVSPGGGNTNTTQWDYVEVNIVGAPSTDHYIALHMCSPPPITTGVHYGEVDNPRIRFKPQCHAVTAMNHSNVTQHSATIGWTDLTSAGSYKVEWGIQGFTPGTGTVDTVHTTSYTIQGLVASTSYEAYVTPICYGNNIASNSIAFQTQCGDIRHSDMPYFYGFEDATSQSMSGNISSCFTRTTNFVLPRPTSMAHSGRVGFYFRNGDTNYAHLALPPIDSTVRDITLNYYIKCDQLPYNLPFRVGVMTNPNDISTFQNVAEFDYARCHSSYLWFQHTVHFTDYNDTGRYIAFCAMPDYNSELGCTIDDITLSVTPSCLPVTSTTVSNIRGSSARLDWRHAYGLTRPTGYEIELIDLSTDRRTTLHDTNTHHVLSGLEPMTEYMACVRSICSDSTYTEWDTVRFSTICLTRELTPSGNDTRTYSGCPVYEGYGNTYSQTIFTAAELHSYGLDSGSISGIKLTWSTNNHFNKHFTILIDSTNATNYPAASSDYWVPMGARHIVYSGPHTIGTSGLVRYDFDHNFHWNGRSNIAITFVMNQDSTQQVLSPFSAYSSYVRSGVSMCVYKNYNPFVPYVTPDTAYETTNYRPNITFMRPCADNSTCTRPYLYVRNISSTNATACWAPGYRENNWRLYYRQSGNTQWIHAATISDTTAFELQVLQPSTTYELRLSPLCTANADSLSDTVSFTTTCAATPLPFHEDFDTWHYGTNDLPLCWRRHYSGNTVYPALSRISAHSDSNSLRINSISRNIAILLPQFDAPVDSLELTLWIYNAGSFNSHLRVGVFEDPDSISSFVQVGPNLSPSATGVWEAFTVPFGSYHGPGRHIAIADSPLANSNIFIDDISVVHANPCPPPTGCHVLTADSTWADIAWNGNGSGTYIVEYGPSGFAPGSGTSFISIDTFATLLSLQPNSIYDYYVRSLCNGRDTSNYSAQASLRTACGEIRQLPYTYGFEDATASGVTGHIDPCWYVGNPEAYNYAITYPIIDQSHSGRWAMRTSSGYIGYLALPQFHANVRDLEISFSYMMDNRANGGVVVGVMTNPEDVSSFSIVQTFSAAAASVWDSVTVQFSSYTGSGRYITIYIPSSNSGNTYIDDVTVSGIGPCPEPADVTVTWVTSSSATLQWTAGGNERRWAIHAFNAGTDIYDTVSSATATLQGLLPATTYSIAVSALCNTAMASPWSDTVTVTTITCDIPVQLTATPYGTGADLQWIPGDNNPSDWQIDYGIEGFNHTSGTMVTNIHAPVYYVRNLTAGNTYQFYVRSVCGAGDTSSWSEPATLRITSSDITTVTQDNLNVVIYPNPTYSSHGATLCISQHNEAESVLITIVDMLGRTVWQHRTQCLKDCRLQLPTDALPRGTYFVRVTSPESTAVQKLTVR
ncbi:MAG: fibronectin type III domain-containing protein [Bacteroidales bacterium]|nr:fibronectin type III domain-containing protein [Bacteroidales bacterium]